MPYRIYAKNSRTGQKVTRMDLDPNHPAINDRRTAEQEAEAFAQTRGAGGPWVPVVEYYAESHANPRWNRKLGGIE